MIIHRHQASSTKDALRDIARDHGDDVFIISNSRVAGRNILYFASDGRPAIKAQAPGTAPSTRTPGVDTPPRDDIQSCLASMQQTIAELTRKLELGQDGQARTLESLQEMLIAQQGINDTLRRRNQQQEQLLKDNLRLTRAMEARLRRHEHGSVAPLRTELHIVLLDESTSGREATVAFSHLLTQHGAADFRCQRFLPDVHDEHAADCITRRQLQQVLADDERRHNHYVLMSLRDFMTERFWLDARTHRKHLYTRRIARFDPAALLRLASNLKLESLWLDQAKADLQDSRTLEQLAKAGIALHFPPAPADVAVSVPTTPGSDAMLADATRLLQAIRNSPAARDLASLATP